MEKLKVAVLEDNQELLKDLIADLKETKLVDLIFYATNSHDFFEQKKTKEIDALILDIELCGDSMSGIDVANKLKLPTLFVSGKSRDFIDRIEELNINHDFPVESIMKPVSLDKLTKILTKFSQRINQLEKSTFIHLNFKEKKGEKINLNSVVCIESETGSGGESNNKKIFFTNRKPEILIDFSFTKMSEKGFDDEIFQTTHKSYRVNVNKIKSYNIDNTLDVEVFDNQNGKTSTKQIPVSDSYRANFRKFKSK